jgi:hypothetical protein
MTNGRGGGGNTGGGGGAPQLGGLFAGGMPKLKPASGSVRQPQPSADDDSPPARRPSRPPNGAPALSLEEELAQRFKKKSEPAPVTNENLRTQRGPPPQPPIQTMPSNMVSEAIFFSIINRFLFLLYFSLIFKSIIEFVVGDCFLCFFFDRNQDFFSVDFLSAPE